MENHFNCIYCYTNKINGKKYVGQAKNFNKRHRGHINASYNEKCKAYNQYFHNAIRKHGIENFEIKILIENLQNQEELNYWECYYIVEFNTLAKNGKGYNLALGGEGGNTLAGKTEEEVAEISRKHSETMKNRTDEELAERSRKISETWKNKSDEELAEIRKKISEAMKGENHGMYGVHRYGLESPNLGRLIARYTLDGKLLDIKYNFEYSVMGFNKGNISLCCKGKRKQHKGFIFKYLSDVPDDVINSYIIRTKQIPITD